VNYNTKRNNCKRSPSETTIRHTFSAQKEQKNILISYLDPLRPIEQRLPAYLYIRCLGSTFGLCAHRRRHQGGSVRTNCGRSRSRCRVM